MKSDILVVEDEDDIREIIAGILSDEGYQVMTCAGSEDTFRAVRARMPTLVILDVWLKGSAMDGIEILDQLKTSHPDLPVIIISGHGTIETAVSAIRKGAYDYIVKPFKAERLLVTTHRALENAQLKSENKDLKDKNLQSEKLIGVSTHIGHLRQKINKIAPTNSRVLITGPSGSGKELIARLIHMNSIRSHGPFQIINAAAMVPERVDIELFGAVDERGRIIKVGLLEKAHYGTLYLDEVADMPLEIQGKLLRLLIDQRFQRLGGDEDVQVDVRVITSTSRDLSRETQLGTFRKDLYHRLNVMPLEVLGLSARREDIPYLVEHFIMQIATMTGLPKRKIGHDAMTALQTHDWPGNVRQLRNNVERLLILASGDPSEPITMQTMPEEISILHTDNLQDQNVNVIAMPLRDAREQFERGYLQAQLDRFDGNISRTADFIGMERSALHRKLKSLGLNVAHTEQKGKS